MSTISYQPFIAQLLLSFSPFISPSFLLQGFFYILDLNQAADYGSARLLQVCKDAEIDCHVADPRDLPIPRGDDGIHPTPEGKCCFWDIPKKEQNERKKLVGRKDKKV